jgi:hypothetical protein
VPSSSSDTAPVANKPTHIRLRHSSTPNSLPSTKTIDIYVKQPFCNEAEDIYVRRLAGWEERVLRARDERRTRRLERIRLAKAATDWNRLLLKEELQNYFSDDDGCEGMCQDLCSNTRYDQSCYPGLDASASRIFLCSSLTHSSNHPIQQRLSFVADLYLFCRKGCSSGFNSFTWQNLQTYYNSNCCASVQTSSCSCSQFSSTSCYQSSFLPLPNSATLIKSDEKKADLHNIVRPNTSLSILRNHQLEIVSENQLATAEAGPNCQGFCSRCLIRKSSNETHFKERTRLRRCSLQYSLMNSIALPLELTSDKQPESFECISKSMTYSSCDFNSLEKYSHIDNEQKSKISVIYDFNSMKNEDKEIENCRENEKVLCDTSQFQCSNYQSDLGKSSTIDPDTSNFTSRLSTNFNKFSVLNTIIYHQNMKVPNFLWRMRIFCVQKKSSQIKHHHYNYSLAGLVLVVPLV